LKKAISFGLFILITMALVVTVAHPVSSQAQIWAGNKQGDIVTVFATDKNGGSS
jgi:hypothetical protein